MEKHKTETIAKRVYTIPLILVLSIWFIYWVEIRFGLNFNKYGVLPRTFKGLRGVVFSPFIHSGPSHLFNNSVPLFVLSSIVLLFYRPLAMKVFLLGGLFTGLLTWIIASEAYHIGASGLVYLLFSFSFFSGLIRQHFRLMAVSFVIIFLYGSMVWYVFPIKEGMSWEGHLSGFIVGAVFAMLYRKKGMVREKFEFSRNEFDDMFDEEGNFVPPPIPTNEEPEANLEAEESPTEEKKVSNTTNDIAYRYVYKENKKPKDL